MPSIVQQARPIALLHPPDSDNGDRRSSKASRQIFGLRLPENVIDSLSKISRDADSVLLALGKAPSLRYGTESQELDFAPSICRHEIYKGTESSVERDLTFAGVVSHSAALKAVQAVTANTDAALAKLKQRMESAQKEKESHRATLVDEVRAGKKTLGSNKKAIPSHRMNLFGSGTPRSVPTSPPTGSTHHASSQSLATMASNSASQESSVPIATAVRVPLLHLLAVKPIREGDVIKILHAPKDVCLKLLEKFGNRNEVDKLWQLSDKWYLDLDVWNFPYSADADREAAVNNSIRAFDRKRLGHDDKHWDRLLPKQKRGKGIVLSKLNLHAGFNPQNPPAKPSLPKPDSALSPPHQNSSALSPMARAKAQGQSKKRKASEAEVTLADPTAIKSPAKPAPSRGTRSQSGAAKVARAGRQKKVGSKVKSAEYADERDLDELGDKDDSFAKASSGPAASKIPNGTDNLNSSKSTKPLKPTSDFTTEKAKPQPAAKEPLVTNRSNHSNSVSSETSSLSSIPSSASPVNQGNARSVPLNNSRVSTEVKKRGLSPAEQSSTSNFNFFNKGARPIPKKRIVRAGPIDSASRITTEENATQGNPVKRANGNPNPDSVETKKVKVHENAAERPRLANKSNIKQEKRSLSNTLPGLDLADLRERRSELQKTYIDLHIRTDQTLQNPQASVENTEPHVAKLWAMHDELEILKHEIQRREAKNVSTDHIKAQYESEYPAYKSLWATVSAASKPPPAEDLSNLWRMHNRLRDLESLMNEAARADIIQRARADIVTSNPSSPTGPLSRRQTLRLYAQYYTRYAKYETTNAAHTAPGAPPVTLADVEADWKMRIRLDDMRRDIVAGFAHISKGLDSPDEPDEEFLAEPDLTQEETTALAKRYADEWPQWFALRKSLLGAPFGSVDPVEMNDLWERQGRLKKWRGQITRASKKFPISQQPA